jgi:hypothetical protein
MHVDEARVLDLQHRFDEAELTDDRATLRELLADDFLSIGPKGAVLTKSEWIDRHKHFRHHALETGEIDIRVYGPTAIVRNVQHSRGVWAEDEIASSVRVSQVWVQQGDMHHWKLAAIQFSPLAEGVKT